MSPRDLAAAFKLNLAADDYDIAAKPSEALAEPEPAMPPGLLSIGQPPAAKKPRGRKKLIVGVMLVAVAGVALALSPELRQKVSGYWADLTDQPIKPPLTGLSKTAGPSKDAADARSNLPDYPPADQPPERATPPALPAAALATTHPAEPAQPPTNWAHVLTSGSVPEGTGSAPGNSPPAAPAVPTPEAPPTPSPEIIELARQTFAKARAAEVRLDYDEAVRQLEKLKSLPRAAWPAEVDVDFQLRLDRNLQSQPK